MRLSFAAYVLLPAVQVSASSAAANNAEGSAGNKRQSREQRVGQDDAYDPKQQTSPAQTTQSQDQNQHKHGSRAQRRQLARTEIIGDCMDANVCGLCQGDCDYDSNCEEGLKCFQRNEKRRNGQGYRVPGCRMGDDDRFDVDYCYDPSFVVEEKEEEEGQMDTDANSVSVGSQEMLGNIMPVAIEGAVVPMVNVNTGVPTSMPTQATGSPTTSRPTTSQPTTGRPTFNPTAAPKRKTHRDWHMVINEERLSGSIRPIIRREPRLMRLSLNSLERDPFRFTEMPSVMPSDMPSTRPSLRPSRTPSALPTAVPSYAPSSAPTITRRDECKIKMYYERKWCWHDDTSSNWDCDRDYSFCAEDANDEFSMQMVDCDESPTTWAVIGYTVRPRNNKKLCWTRRVPNGIRLMPCEENEGHPRWENQRFLGVCMDDPTPIRPAADPSFCLTSGHEPRSGEVLKFQECNKVDNSNTHLWVEK